MKLTMVSGDAHSSPLSNAHQYAMFAFQTQNCKSKNFAPPHLCSILETHSLPAEGFFFMRIPYLSWRAAGAKNLHYMEKKIIEVYDDEFQNFQVKSKQIGRRPPGNNTPCSYVKKSRLAAQSLNPPDRMQEWLTSIFWIPYSFLIGSLMGSFTGSLQVPYWRPIGSILNC